MRENILTYPYGEIHRPDTNGLNSPGLIISDPVYIPDENPEKTDGGDGTYHWYVTSYIPGDYEFTAYSMPPGSDELKGRIFVPVSIANKPN